MALTFLPWLRQGLAANINSPDNASFGDSQDLPTDRAALDLSVAVNGGAVPVTKVQLLGPGDVTGIDQTQILRVDPPPSYRGHEITHFPCIEFHLPSFLWAFTPASAEAKGRLRPWLTLIVVEQQDGVTLTQAAGKGVGVLTIAQPANPGGELPDPSTLWYWGHVQLAGSVSEAGLDDLLIRQSERALCRLICSRPLKTSTRYVACVVPSFAVGRDAALAVAAGSGQSSTGPASNGKLAPAWTGKETSSMRLPVFYSWEFETATEGGDFRTLAQQLRPQHCPWAVGQLKLDVSSAGLSWPPAPGGSPQESLTMFGALRCPGGGLPAPSPEVRSGLATALRGDGTGRELRLPLYGGLYPAETSVGQADPGWLAELNLDPRHRVAAALGAQVVLNEQEQMVAAVEEQVGRLREVNQLLSGAQMARAAMTAVHSNDLTPLPAPVLLQVTQPLHDRVRTDVLTANAVLEQSSLPSAFVSPAFRRLTRARGPIGSNLLAASTPTTAGQTASAASELGTNHAETVPTSPAMRALSLSGVLDASPPLRGRVQQENRLTSQSAPANTPASDLAGILLDRIQPESTVPDRILPRVTAPARPTRDMLDDPLARQLVSPSLPTPLYSVLSRHAPQFLLPGAEALPANSITLLEPSPEFIGALLVGANHQLGAELVWRGLAVDRRTTFFQRFFDFHGTGKETAVDIAPIDQWPNSASLGNNLDGGRNELILAIRGDLLRRYPRTAVYAVPADSAGGPDQARPDAVVNPSFTGFVDPDIRFFGFELSAAVASGSSGGNGYFFMLQERFTETRFGSKPGAQIASDDTSADVALKTLQNPVLVAIHARDLLPKGV